VTGTDVGGKGGTKGSDGIADLRSVGAAEIGIEKFHRTDGGRGADIATDRRERWSPRSPPESSISGIETFFYRSPVVVFGFCLL
jgi:hypothetical protein